MRNETNAPILDYVIRRHDEEIEPLITTLNMMALQRNADMDDFMVTIISTGGKHDYDVIEDKYPFRIKVVGIETESLSKAYNEAIIRSETEWIQFMQYGDLMADLYSVSMSLNLLPTDEYDMVWTDYYDEYTFRRGGLCVNMVTDVTPNLNGKLFRINFLKDRNIWFDEKISRDEGIVFFYTAQSETDYQRFAKISTKFIPYTNILRPVTDSRSVPEIVLDRHRMNMAIIRNLIGRKNMDSYMQAVMKTICNAYNFLHTEGVESVREEIETDIRKLCSANELLIRKMKPQDTEVFLDEAEQEMFVIIQDANTMYGHEMYFDVDNVSYEKWVRQYLENGEDKKKLS